MNFKDTLLEWNLQVPDVDFLACQEERLSSG